MARTDLDALAARIHEGNVERGFYDDEPHGECAPVTELIAKLGLIVTEVAEAIEAVRAPWPQPSEKVPEATCEEEEIADVLIRTLDYAAYRELRLDLAVERKLEANARRGYRHGGKRA